MMLPSTCTSGRLVDFENDLVLDLEAVDLVREDFEGDWVERLQEVG